MTLWNYSDRCVCVCVCVCVRVCVCDYPLFLQAILMQWESYANEHKTSDRGHKLDIPSVEGMVVATELGLDPNKQQLQEVNRNPGENNVC